MGLFDFVKDLGKRVINTDEGVAKDIKESIEANNPGVKNFGVDFERGIATLKGHCDSGDAHMRVVDMVKRHEGVIDVYFHDLTYNETKPAAESVGAKIAAAEAAPAAAAVGGGDKEPSAGEPKMEEYTIVSGDTLGGLAKKYYGDAMQYPRIFEANRDTIEDPNKIYVGQKIRIPLD